MNSGHQEQPAPVDIESLQDDVLRKLDELNQRLERTLSELNRQHGQQDSAGQG